MSTDKKLKELQLLEQSSQQYVMQKQQFQAQFIEIESAINELKKTDTSYKIVGNIMVKADKKDLEKDLKEKLKMFDIRIKSLEKQEEKIKDKAKELQKEVLSEMKNDK